MQSEPLDRLNFTAADLYRAIRHAADLVQYVNVEKDVWLLFGAVDEILGYGPSDYPRSVRGALELSMSEWLELIHPDDVGRISTATEEMIERGGTSWEFRYRIRRKDGSYRHWIDRGTVLGHIDGHANEAIGAIIDETEEVVTRQKLEQALAEVNQLKTKLEAETRYLQEEIRLDRGFDEIIGRSRPLLTALQKVDMVSSTESSVLLLGETGTGKELLARAIHAGSARNDRPLIKVDCGTLPSGLIESELFGHMKGAFTGAHESKTGRFELADKGTIFLDEIGDLPLDLQPKLLRAVEDGVIQRIGGTDERRVDVRVIAATNRDLQEALEEGCFRSDLYYRISVFPIESPPLRERRDDIPLLVSFFVSKFAPRIGKTIDSVSSSSMDALVAYNWPGNVRELRNVIERSVILCSDNILDVTEALGEVASSPRPRAGRLKDDLLAVERSRIVQALEESGWKIKGAGNAAERLGLSPSTLRSKMKKLGIVRPQ